MDGIFVKLLILCTFVYFTSPMALYNQPVTSYEIIDLQNKTGLYYENIGNLKLFSNHWNLVIYSSLSEFDTQYKAILLYHQKILSLCEQFLSTQESLNQCITLPIQSSMILDRLNEQDLIINKYLGTTVKPRLLKRGLLNVVGTISKQLFGTLDDNDAKMFSEHIQNLDQQQSHAFNLYEKQISVSKNIIHQLNLTNDQLLALEEKLEKTNLNIEKIQLNQNNHDYLTESFFQLTELFTMFNSLSEYYYSAKSHLLEAIYSAAHGKLHPYLIDPSKLTEEIRKIQSFLPEDNRLPFPLQEQYIDKLLNILETHIYFSNGKIHFLLKIPLTTSKSYSIYKMTSIPNLVGNNSYSVIIPEKPLLVIDSEKQSYFLYEEQNLEKCFNTHKNNYICEQNGPILFTHLSNACELNLLSTLPSTPNSCKMQIMQIFHPIFLQLADSNSWLFVSPNPENLIIKCRKFNSQLTINSTGILKIDSTCVANTKYQSLNSKTNYETDTNLNFISSAIPVSAPNITQFHFAKLPIIETQTFTIRNQINDLNAISKSLDDINYQQISQPFVNSSNNKHITTIHILLAILFLMMSIVIALLRKLYKQKEIRKDLVISDSLPLPLPKPRSSTNLSPPFLTPRKSSSNLSRSLPLPKTQTINGPSSSSSSTETRTNARYKFRT